MKQVLNFQESFVNDVIISTKRVAKQFHFGNTVKWSVYNRFYFTFF